mmetsp:Transcript_25043/g.57669  ORF Transcript_25043/g.57669 Transcript_25043/m.57669 type:complete len:1323 (-) Transcript_25043:31-3999(-)
MSVLAFDEYDGAPDPVNVESSSARGRGDVPQQSSQPTERVNTDFAPVLNEYKLEFFKRRFAQSVFGGARFNLTKRAPFYVYAFQLLIFVLPAIVGIVFSQLQESQIIESVWISMAVGGGVMSICFAALQGMSGYLRTTGVVELGGLDMLKEEDEVDFEGCLSPETFEFVLPSKGGILSVLAQGSATFVLCGLSIGYLVPSAVNHSIGNSGISSALQAVGWLVLCLSQYGLTAVVAPEPNQSGFNSALTPLMRPFYLFVVYLLFCLEMYAEVPGLSSVNVGLRWTAALLPLFWLFGMLPQIEILVLWFMEQLLVVAHGGSAMASPLRITVAVLAAHAALAAVVAAHRHVNTQAGLGLAVATALLLSQDLLPWRSNWPWVKASAYGVWCRVGLTLLGVGAALGVGMGPDLSTVPPSRTVADVQLPLDCVAAALLFVSVVSAVAQHPRVFGVRNTLFRMGKPSKMSIPGALHILSKVAIRVLMPAYVCLYHEFSPVLPWEPADSAGTKQLDAAVLGCLFVTRGVRRALQNPGEAMWELAVTVWLRRLVPQVHLQSWWLQLHLAGQLLVVGTLLSRGREFWHKLLFAITLTVTSWTDKKGRAESAKATLILSACLWPLVLCVIVMASAVSAPLLPLLGVPVFLCAFPRPLRHWPDSGGRAGGGTDGQYYAQMSPRLAQEFVAGLNSGKFGLAPPGSYFICRRDGYIILIQILESGCGYTLLHVKGLELQETSCHTVEAAVLDEMLEQSLGEGQVESKPGPDMRPLFDPRPHHLLKPMASLCIVNYSVSEVNLTGVIDRPEAPAALRQLLARALVWRLMQPGKEIPAPWRQIPAMWRRELDTLAANVFPEEFVQAMQKSYNRQTPPVVTTAAAAAQSPRGGQTESPGFELVVRNGASPAKAAPALSTLSLPGTPASPRTQARHLGEAATPEASKPNSNRNSHNLPGGIRESPHTEAIPAPGSDDGAVSDLEEENLDDLLADLEDTNAGGGGKKTAVKPPPPDDLLSKIGGGQDSDGLLSKIGGGDDDLLSKIGGASDKSDDLLSHIGGGNDDLLGKIGGAGAGDSGLLGKIGGGGGDNDLDKLFRDIGVKNPGEKGGKLRPASDTLSSVSRGQTAKIASSSDGGAAAGLQELVVACWAMVEEWGGASKTKLQVIKCFNGDLPQSVQAEWLDDKPQLKQELLISYRYAVKVFLDSMVYGLDPEDNTEVIEAFTEYDRFWHMGPDGSAEWGAAVEKSTPHLLSLRSVESLPKAKMLSLVPALFQVGKLNEEAVRGLWASLGLELLYFTNDDDERYSIQAQAHMLRNIMVQAAEPPLGYPVFVSTVRVAS